MGQLKLRHSGDDQKRPVPGSVSPVSTPRRVLYAPAMGKLVDGKRVQAAPAATREFV